MQLSNQTMANYKYLRTMHEDSYFPSNLVKKGEEILVELCQQIEQQKPTSVEDLYKLTHAATARFNKLTEEFDEQGSELETGAREAIGEDFANIAKAYGFSNADSEELIATRDW
jgi:hypothetical protein